MTKQEQLEDARAALHEAMLGRSPRVVVDSNGERIEYSAVNTAKLEGYIAKLEIEIANGGPTRRGPAGVVF